MGEYQTHTFLLFLRKAKKSFLWLTVLLLLSGEEDSNPGCVPRHVPLTELEGCAKEKVLQGTFQRTSFPGTHLPDLFFLKATEGPPAADILPLPSALFPLPHKARLRGVRMTLVLCVWMWNPAVGLTPRDSSPEVRDTSFIQSSLTWGSVS